METANQRSRSSPITLPGGYVLISGQWRKEAFGSIDIPFGYKFKEAPIVTISPFYDGGVAVTPVDTIVGITHELFTVASGNAAPNFYINWIALGLAGS